MVVCCDFFVTAEFVGADSFVILTSYVSFPLVVWVTRQHYLFRKRFEEMSYRQIVKSSEVLTTR